MENKAEKIRSR